MSDQSRAEKEELAKNELWLDILTELTKGAYAYARICDDDAVLPRGQSVKGVVMEVIAQFFRREFQGLNNLYGKSVLTGSEKRRLVWFLKLVIRRKRSHLWALKELIIKVQVRIPLDLDSPIRPDPMDTFEAPTSSANAEEREINDIFIKRVSDHPVFKKNLLLRQIFDLEGECVFKPAEMATRLSVPVERIYPAKKLLNEVYNDVRQSMKRDGSL